MATSIRMETLPIYNIHDVMELDTLEVVALALKYESPKVTLTGTAGSSPTCSRPSHLVQDVPDVSDVVSNLVG